MSRALFVDTGGWFALQIPNDRWHAAARRALEDAVARRVRLLTTNVVVGETYTLLRMSHGHAAAWQFVKTLGRSALLESVRIDERMERDAWEILRKHEDQAFSFVDGTSFAFMRSRRLRYALAFDHHFATAGFHRVEVDGSLP